MDWLAGGDRQELAVERIYSAAAELTRERGLDALSADEVAARAGCSRATLYRHVGGKRAIVDGLVARGAAAVAGQVADAVAHLDGAERTVAAILASVSAVRAEPVLLQGFTSMQSAGGDGYLATSPLLGDTAVALTGEADASAWIVRVVLSLLRWPLADEAAERRMVERFVAPAFSVDASSIGPTPAPGGTP